MISLIYGIQKNDNMLIDRENRLVVARGRDERWKKWVKGDRMLKKFLINWHFPTRRQAP